MGHVVRCLALADELWENHGCTISFAMRTSELGMSKVREKYPVLTAPEAHFNYSDWLSDCIQKTDAQVLIMDVRDGLHRANLVQIKKQTGIKIVTIDDPEDKRLAADLAFYPPVPQVLKMNWADFRGELFTGWEWVILRPEFAAWRKKNDGISHAQSSYKSSPPNVLVTMGGSDPAGLTIKTLQSLNMLQMDFRAIIVLGPGFASRETLEELLCHIEFKYTIFEDVTDMVSVMVMADLAIASFGMTAYELAMMRVPAIYLCLTTDHAESALAFVDAGIAISLGVYDHLSTNAVAVEINNILQNKSLQTEMISNAREKIDGRGVSRISDIIMRRMDCN